MDDLAILVSLLKRMEWFAFQDRRPTGGSQYVVIDGHDYDVTDEEMAILEKYFG